MTTTIAANAVAAAHIQGLHAFIASEAKAAATDDQLEAATGFLAGVTTPHRAMCSTIEYYHRCPS